jgi:hypothetical protein
MKPKSKSKSAQKITQSSLAAQLGVSRQLIAAHCKKPNSPALDDLQGWIVFLAQVGRTGSCPPELRTAIAQKRLEILNETKIKLARENEVESGKLIPFAHVVRQACEAGGFFMSELERWTRELPPMLAGKSCAETAQVMDAQIERTRAELKAKLDAIQNKNV